MKYVYTTVLTPYEGGYVATVPDVPGCTSGGKDLSETLEMTKDALCGCMVAYDPTCPTTATRTNRIKTWPNSCVDRC